MKSSVHLKEAMQFDVEIDEYDLVIDAKPEHGGTGGGPNPKAMLLTSLAGCAAMDVISILRKMRAEPDTLEITASAELTDEHPKVFTGMTVHVVATGGIPAKKLWKAVALSRDRYCGVAAMLKAHGPIDYVVELDGENLPEPGS